MTRKKLRVGVLFGGKSVEHEVSVVSGQKVLACLDPERYEAVPFLIDQKGRWQLVGREPSTEVLSSEVLAELFRLDVVFPALHGTFGEDGAMQGFLKVLGLPFVGCDVLASALAMDKETAKRLLRAAGMAVVPWILLRREEELWRQEEKLIGQVERELQFPVVVKPCSLGSSVGVVKVYHPNELAAAVQQAFCYDAKVLIEVAVQAREIECSVVGSGLAVATSLPCEIVLMQEFHTYDSKYAPGASVVQVPPQISGEEIAQVRTRAVEAYRTLGCEGLARVDFFLTAAGELFINEINTIPGLTPTSGYPIMWEQSGVSFAHVVDRLIELALARAEGERSLQRDRRIAATAESS